jgi:hypothetical protein
MDHSTVPARKDILEMEPLAEISMNVLEITVVTSIQHVPISLVRIIVVVTLDSLEMELTAQISTNV